MNVNVKIRSRKIFFIDNKDFYIHTKDFYFIEMLFCLYIKKFWKK